MDFQSIQQNFNVTKHLIRVITRSKELASREAIFHHNVENIIKISMLWLDCTKYTNIFIW